MSPVEKPTQADNVELVAHVRFTASFAPPFDNLEHVAAYYNEGTWCANQLIGAMQRFAAKKGCACAMVDRVTVISVNASLPYRDECSCICHERGGMMHVRPCCRPRTYTQEDREAAKQYADDWREKRKDGVRLVPFIDGEPLEATVQRVTMAVGNMVAFPDEDHLGVTDDKRDTLNEFMANTWLADKWPDLLRRAAEVAVNTVRASEAEPSKAARTTTTEGEA